MAHSTDETIRVSMVVTNSKLASLAIVFAYVALALFAGHAIVGDLLTLCMMLIIPLGLIWFPDELGSVSPVHRGGKWTTQDAGRWAESPGIIVAAMGWFFLIGMPLLICLLTS